MNFRFQQTKGIPMETIVNTISSDGMKLMMDMLLWNPEKRPSAANVRGRESGLKVAPFQKKFSVFKELNVRQMQVFTF